MRRGWYVGGPSFREKLEAYIHPRSVQYMRVHKKQIPISIFIAASKDEKLHAFDEETGKLLCQAKLPAGGYATPATYQLKGRQYVVIALGGGKMHP